ncbi:MAG: YncE family protein, partial [Thermoplasmata archaeon]|nr:YncE family protein [Candidatus Sysuiplasma superficiale]
AGWLYVANKGSNNVTVISTVTLGSVMNISVGTAPAALAMNATGFVFVANSGSGNVSQINTTGVVNMTYRVGNDPVALAFNATGFLMVANKLSNNLTVINTTSESIVKTPVSSFHNLSAPDAIATNMSGNVLVANMASGNLTVYSPSLAFIGNISIGKTAEPDSILSFAANFTLVADNGTGNVAVVNTTAMKVSLYNETGVNPTSLAMDSSNGQIYLADMGSNNLTQLAAMPVPMTDNMTVMQINSVTDYGLTSIAGVTPANGTISVLLAANPNVNFSVQGSVFLSYVFLGDYAAGGAVAGAAPWDIIGEMTSATNPSGFGVQQPVELPVEVAQSTAAANVTISVTAMNSALSPTASTTLLVRAVNTTTGAPVASYPVTLMSQNALGANRGLLINSTGTPVQAFNPNVFFGSTYIPGITLMTNSTGYAMATFSPGLYTPMYSPNGTFVGFSPQSYTDNYLIPFDEFQITAVGMTGEVGGVTVYSNQSVNNVTPSPVVFAYIAGESSLNGVTVLPGNGTYTMYVNSTENSPYGPSTSGVSVTVSVSLGSVSVSSGTTGSNGSFVISYNAPNVSVLTPVTIGISTGSGTITETIYLVPHYVVTKTITTTVTKTKTVTTTVSSALFEGLTGLFIILTVIFAVLYVSARRKGGNKGSANPPQQ